jgi:hypothetical protein
MRIFASSDNVVEFEPVREGDEPLAKQATTYVNHVFYKDNDGFSVLHNWFKDALLQKVWGYEGQVNTRTVDTHIKRLRQKLGTAGSMIETIHGFGYQLIES